MSTNHIEVIDTTIQKTNLWLKDLMNIMKWSDYHKAYTALRSVLHAVRDRLTPEVAVKVGAQMPMLIRGCYYEGWKLAITPLRVHTKEEFIEIVVSEIPNGIFTEETEDIIKAVCTVMKRHLSTGEIEHIRANMPHQLQAWWK